jgi:N-acetylneuraminic acid mutarotase
MLKVFQWKKHTSEGGPTKRSASNIVRRNNCLYVYGGYADPYRFYDLYEFNMINCKWKRITTNTEPPERSGQSGVILNDELLIFGGCNGSGQDLNDLYRFVVNEICIDEK